MRGFKQKELVRTASAYIVIGIFLLACGLGRAAAETNVYRNETVGLEIEKPASWHFLGVDAVQQSRDRVKMDDKAFEEQLRKRARLPIVALSKYANPETRQDVTPTVNVVYSKLGPLQGQPVDKLLAAALGPFEKQFPDVVYETKPVAATLSGQPAAKAVFFYALKTQGEHVFKVRSEFWIVPREDGAFLIGFSGPAKGKDVSKKEFQRILKSIRLSAPPGKQP